MTAIMPNIPWTAREAGTDGSSGRIPFNGSIRRCWPSCLIFSDGMGQYTSPREKTGQYCVAMQTLLHLPKPQSNWTRHG